MASCLAPPPRHIPLSLRLQLLFGGFNNTFGWFFLGIGLACVWAFGGTEALRNQAFFSGELAVVEGQVTAVTPTNIRINKTPIDAYQYRYRADGIEHTGTTEYFHGRYSVDGTVPVEYPVADPARARIRGLYFGSPEAAGAASLFSAVGLVFIGFGIRQGRKAIRLLRTGRMAMGELVEKTVTNTRINGRAVYKFRFRFKAADGGLHIATAKTHELERLEVAANPAESQRPLFYNPAEPEEAVLLGTLPAEISIDPRGEIGNGGSGLPASLLIPALAVGGHGAWVLHVLEIF